MLLFTLLLLLPTCPLTSLVSILIRYGILRVRLEADFLNLKRENQEQSSVGGKKGSDVDINLGFERRVFSFSSSYNLRMCLVFLCTAVHNM